MQKEPWHLYRILENELSPASRLSRPPSHDCSCPSTKTLSSAWTLSVNVLSVNSEYHKNPHEQWLWYWKQRRNEVEANMGVDDTPVHQGVHFPQGSKFLSDDWACSPNTVGGSNCSNSYVLLLSSLMKILMKLVSCQFDSAIDTV